MFIEKHCGRPMAVVGKGLLCCDLCGHTMPDPIKEK